MTQPIASWRPSAWPSPGPADAPGLGGAAAPAPSNTITVPEPPDLPDAPVRPLQFPGLGRSAAAASIGAMTGATSRAAADAAARARLDGFKAAMSGPYHTRDGDCWAPTPFRMSSYAAAHSPTAAVLRSARLSDGAVAQIRAGRGTADDIRRLTQALIDEIGRPPDGGAWTGEKIQRLMFHYGIGIDCAGYVQQAYLAATQQSRSRAGFGPILDEALFGLERRGFQRVASPAALRPGDIAVFGPPGDGQPGHRVMIYDQRPATADELRRLSASKNPSVIDFIADGPVIKVLADSSWGSYQDPRFGGVQRQTWWYNESTKMWGFMNLEPKVVRSVTPDGDTQESWQLSYEFRVSSRPSPDPLEGFYRRGAP